MARVFRVTALTWSGLGLFSCEWTPPEGEPAVPRIDAPLDDTAESKARTDLLRERDAGRADWAVVLWLEGEGVADVEELCVRPVELYADDFSSIGTPKRRADGAFELQVRGHHLLSLSTGLLVGTSDSALDAREARYFTQSTCERTGFVSLRMEDFGQVLDGVLFDGTVELRAPCRMATVRFDHRLVDPVTIRVHDGSASSFPIALRVADPWRGGVPVPVERGQSEVEIWSYFRPRGFTIGVAGAGRVPLGRGSTQPDGGWIDIELPERIGAQFGYDFGILPNASRLLVVPEATDSKTRAVRSVFRERFRTATAALVLPGLEDRVGTRYRSWLVVLEPGIHRAELWSVPEEDGARSLLDTQLFEVERGAVEVRF